MRRLTPLLALCLLSGCATLGAGNDETGRKYVVFFTKGSSRIEGAGTLVVSQAAAVAQRHPDRIVVVAGYAAAHGDLNADQRIARARSEAVSHALAVDGVAPSRIADQARPPANEDPGVAARRVEIGFRSP